MRIDKHTLAVISLTGSSLDVLGALYLAYDLLGGEHGPLRTLTRSVTYGAIFGVGTGLVLGPIFGLAVGVTHGWTLAWEYSRASRNRPRPGVLFDAGMSAIRGLGYAVGSAVLLGTVFGLVFGALSTIGQLIAYRWGIRPTMDYGPAPRPRITWRQILAALNRAVGYGIAGYLSALAAHHRPGAIAFGLKLALVVGLVSAVVGACVPLIEWSSDHMPARRMGVFGIAAILLGFLLQSVQYWLTLLNVNIS